MVPEWMKDAPNPFDTVLVANRGEIAVRIIKAVQEAGLRAIAIYSEPDKDHYTLRWPIKPSICLR